MVKTRKKRNPVHLFKIRCENTSLSEAVKRKLHTDSKLNIFTSLQERMIHGRMWLSKKRTQYVIRRLENRDKILSLRGQN